MWYVKCITEIIIPVLLPFSLQFFWALGSCFTVGVAMAVMPTLGWRWLLGFLSLPLLLFVVMSYVSETVNLAIFIVKKMYNLHETN